MFIIFFLILAIGGYWLDAPDWFEEHGFFTLLLVAGLLAGLTKKFLK